MVLRKKQVGRAALAVLAASSLALSCSKKKSSTDTAATDAAPSAEGFISAGNGVTGSVLSAAFPSELALSAFPQSSGASLRLADAAVEDPNADKTVTDKVAENEKRLKGEGDCFNPEEFKQFKPADPITCYDFDTDMNPTEVAGSDHKFGTKDGTNGAGEACMVSYARSEVVQVSQRVDRALAMISGMLCQATKDGAAVDLPAVGETLDLVASMEGGGSKIATKVSKASMTRLEDVDGQAVFRSDVSITDPNGNEDEVHLVHSPADDGTSTGTLWFKRKASSKLMAGQQSDPNNSANKYDVMSINYAKTLVGERKRMTAELRRASIVDTIEPFEANGLVAYGNLAEEAKNAEVSAIKYVAFDVYPDTNEGTLSYWMNPGGSYKESARGFLFSMSANDDGTLAGCGISGATANVSIRMALIDPSEAHSLKPVRFWHPRENQNISADKDPDYVGNEGAFITQQCFKQNATSGLYEIDTAETAGARGYDIIAQAATKVERPEAPPAKLDGNFKPAE